MNGWRDFVVEEREKDLEDIIQQEKLKPEETRKFLENSFREGEIKTVGTDIDKFMNAAHCLRSLLRLLLQRLFQPFGAICKW